MRHTHHAVPYFCAACGELGARREHYLFVTLANRVVRDRMTLAFVAERFGYRAEVENILRRRGHLTVAA